jgi:hypothetical protein
VVELLVKAYGQLVPQTSHHAIFICGVACKTKCTKEIPTYYTNVKKMFRKKYPGFLQQRCSM